MTKTQNEKKRRKVVYPKGLISVLAKKMKVNEKTVRRAFSFERSTEVCKEILNEAYKHGAYVESRLPEGETFHDANGMMRQVLLNGAVIEIDKETGNVSVFFKEKIIGSWPNLLIRELEEIQKWAAELSA